MIDWATVSNEEIEKIQLRLGVVIPHDEKEAENCLKEIREEEAKRELKRTYVPEHRLPGKQHEPPSDD